MSFSVWHELGVDWFMRLMPECSMVPVQQFNLHVYPVCRSGNDYAVVLQGA